MKPKVIYLCYIPLNNKIEIDFYMNDLCKEGFSIEYWDLSEIFFPNIAFDIKVKRPYIVNIHDYKELEEMIMAQDIINCFFIVIIVFNGMVIKLHRILTKNGCYLIYFARSGIPTFSINESIFRKAVNNYHNCLSIGKLKDKCLYEIAKINKKIGLIKNYDLVFAAGAVEVSSYDAISKVVPVNHWDYDQYLCLKDNRDRLITDEYCVFLDDNIIYNVDFKINNIKTIKSGPYFKSLCNFFDYLESKFALKVVIAVHPKAEYRGNEFGDRCIMKDKTNELVKECQFTISHYSTSTAFAILYKKPLLLIYTEEMKRGHYYKLIIQLADVLGANVYNIDALNKHNLIELKEPDLLKYHSYKYNYLTSKLTDCKLTKNIFMDYICSQ